jgi:hypothetical protein
VKLARLRIESESDHAYTLVLRGPKAALRRIQVGSGKQSLRL